MFQCTIKKCIIFTFKDQCDHFCSFCIVEYKIKDYKFSCDQNDMMLRVEEHTQVTEALRSLVGQKVIYMYDHIMY